MNMNAIETEASQQPIIEPTKTIKPKSFPGLKIIIAIIVILLFGTLTTGIYVGYHEYQKIIQQNKALALKTDELTTNILKLQQDQQALQNIIKQLRQNSSMSYYLNVLSTTDQLVTAANLAIKSENNTTKALDLLNTALRRIRDIHEFSPITQALENDITAIKSIVAFDPEKTILQLNKISQQITTLTQALAPNKKDILTKEPNTVSNEHTWQKIITNISHALRNVVTVSHRENVPMALTSSQLINLKLNLHALLLETTLAVNNHQSSVYQNSLKEVVDLLQTYFPANEEIQTVILPTIQQLQQIDINTTKINLDNSLKLIETTLEQKSTIDITNTDTIN